MRQLLAALLRLALRVLAVGDLRFRHDRPALGTVERDDGEREPPLAVVAADVLHGVRRPRVIEHRLNARPDVVGTARVRNADMIEVVHADAEGRGRAGETRPDVVHGNDPTAPIEHGHAAAERVEDRRLHRPAGAERVVGLLAGERVGEHLGHEAKPAQTLFRPRLPR